MELTERNPIMPEGKEYDVSSETIGTPEYALALLIPLRNEWVRGVYTTPRIQNVGTLNLVILNLELMISNQSKV